jgi:hypothetical protein
MRGVERSAEAVQGLSLHNSEAQVPAKSESYCWPCVPVVGSVILKSEMGALACRWVAAWSRGRKSKDCQIVTCGAQNKKCSCGQKLMSHFAEGRWPASQTCRSAVSPDLLAVD